MYLRDAQTGKQKSSLRDYKGWAFGVAFSPDSKEVAIGTGRPASMTRTGKPVPGFGEIVVWDTSTGKVRRRIGGLGEAVLSLTYSPDGRTLAATVFGRVQLFDACSGDRTRAFSGGPAYVRALAFSTDGKRVAAGGMEALEPGQGEKGALSLWNVVSGDLLCRWGADNRRVSSLAFSPDGSTLASGGPDGSLKLWAIPRRIRPRSDEGLPRQIHSLTGHQAEVVTLAYDRSGQRLASGSVDGTVYLWNAREGRQMAQLTFRP